ncbi:MAG: hypothetical protein L0Y55_17115 [Anaerolineales bacterium]|nr:hypothetical protein [Anaerolineales bacterium]
MRCCCTNHEHDSTSDARAVYARWYPRYRELHPALKNEFQAIAQFV